jgi:outer membrane protein assembly factor BamE (lipoprotein component of BamABCDE complex)
MKIEEGSTTKNHVNTLLGDPMETAFIADGQEVWTYELSKIKPFVRNFIPYVWIFSSGSNGVQQQLTILFDENDVVGEYRWNESKIQHRGGILTNVN